MRVGESREHSSGKLAHGARPRRSVEIVPCRPPDGAAPRVDERISGKMAFADRLRMASATALSSSGHNALVSPPVREQFAMAQGADGRIEGATLQPRIALGAWADQIARAVTVVQHGAFTELRLSVSTLRLSDVRVRLRCEQGRVYVRLQTTRAEDAVLLRRSAGDLKAIFAQRGSEAEVIVE